MQKAHLPIFRHYRGMSKSLFLADRSASLSATECQRLESAAVTDTAESG